MSQILTDQALDQLFRNARTANGWLPKPVTGELLHKIYDLMKFAPTSANSSPLRLVFLTSEAAKERLKPSLMAGNVDKVMTAPVVAVLAMDMQFYDHLPFLFPHTDARPWFAGNDKVIYDTAFRNSSLQAGYFIMAARACGLDCGPMSGFDAEAVNKEFFPDGRFKVNMICGLGYADTSKTFARSPRFSFEQACAVL